MEPNETIPIEPAEPADFEVPGLNSEEMEEQIDSAVAAMRRRMSSGGGIPRELLQAE